MALTKSLNNSILNYARTLLSIYKENVQYGKKY
jgi:hypothetical protein